MSSLLLAMLLYLAHHADAQYHGKLVGTFSSFAHDVGGTVYAVNNRTLRIIGFSYDGTAPDAFLWGGETEIPNHQGFIIPKEDGSEIKLGLYSNADIEVTLPASKSVSNLRSISVWCRRFTANFGDVTFDSGFVPPSPYNLGALGFTPRVHATSASAVWVLNPREIRFEDLFYDGFGPDAYFWVGPGDTPSYDKSYRIPDETGSGEVIGAYTGQTITVTLPDNITVFDIGHIGLWCVIFKQDFGHVDISSMDVLNIPPLPLTPSLSTTTTAASMTTTTPKEFNNCEVLVKDELQVSWYINGTHIVIRISSTNDVGRYTAFGVSGSSTSTQMVGGDVAVTFVDANGVTQAVDYYLSSRAQCSPQNGDGACPDVIALSSNLNDVTLIESSSYNGVTHIVYRRPLAANDAIYDKAISTTGPTYVIWARGLINADSRVAYHSSDRSPASSNLQINFGRESSTCDPLGDQTGTTPSNPSSVTPPSSEGWTIEGIVKANDAEFTVEMGLTGGQKGYNFITGNVGWGIAWFIDGQLIPELTLTRGKTYKFLVSGGDNPAQSANYHPFYITDDPSGGYAQLSIKDQENITIYAGPEEGPLCQWTATTATGNADSYDTFEEYKGTLTTVCQPGEPGVLEWTVPMDAPDLLYYHCYTHRFLGWKIHLVDGEEVPSTTTTKAPVTDSTTTTTTTTTNAPVTDSTTRTTTTTTTNAPVTDYSTTTPTTTTSSVAIIATAAAVFAAIALVFTVGWWFWRQ